MRKKIQRMGDSAVIALSKDVLALMDMEVGDEVEIRFRNKTMLVSLATKQKLDKNVDIDAAVDEVFSNPQSFLERLSK